MGRITSRTRLNTSVVAATMRGVRSRRSAGRGAAQPPRMAEKMVRSTSSEAGGMQSTWKWRVKRGVTLARPPPGGAAAPTTTVSTTSFQNSLARS